MNAQERNALKSAIASHPHWGALKAQHGLTSTRDLTVGQLQNIALALGISTAPDTGDSTDTVDSAATDAVDAGAETVDAPVLAPLQAAVSRIFSGDFRDTEQRAQHVLAELIAAAEDNAARTKQIEQSLANQVDINNTLRNALANATATVINAAPVTAAPIAAAPVAIKSQTRAAFVDPYLGQKLATEVFGMRNECLRGLQVSVFSPSIDTPQIDSGYKFDAEALADAIVGAETGTGVWFYGTAGTGKTTFAEQFAARTGRAFACLSFQSGLDGPELIGMQVSEHTFKYGAFTLAVQKPGALVLLDEVCYARAGALGALNAPLQQRYMTITDTGEVIQVASRVVFFAADNTRGYAEAANYTDTRQSNYAFRSRFPITIHLEPFSPGAEAKIIHTRTAAPIGLCNALAQFASVTRVQAQGGNGLTEGIGPRALFALARLLVAGRNPDRAFDSCILGNAPPEDVEALRMLKTSHWANAETIGALARGEVPAAAPAPATLPENAAAAEQFTD